MLISSEQLGVRLADARKRAKLTQAHVAERVGLARTTMVAIEKGERRPANTELVALADVLGVHIHDLLRPNAVRAVSSAVRVRPGMPEQEAAAVTSAIDRVRALGARYVELERMLELPRPTAPIEALQAYRRGEYAAIDPRRDGEDAARSVRGILGLGDEAAHGIDERFETGAGLRIFSVALPGNIGAILLWGEEIGGCVGLNRDHPEARRRWSLAYELGRFLRDREEGDVLELNAPNRRDTAFAAAFANELLMPAIGIERRFVELCRLGKFTPMQIQDLARSFGVSFQAMAVRLEELRLLPHDTYDGILHRSVHGRASTLHTPPPAIAALGLPDRYVELAIAAYDQELISERELAEILATDIAGARAVRDNLQIPIDDDRHLAADHAGADLRTPWI